MPFPKKSLYTCYLGDKEIVGTLVGFDDYVNMVLEDVVSSSISFLNVNRFVNVAFRLNTNIPQRVKK